MKILSKKVDGKVLLSKNDETAEALSEKITQLEEKLDKLTGNGANNGGNAK